MPKYKLLAAPHQAAAQSHRGLGGASTSGGGAPAWAQPHGPPQPQHPPPPQPLQQPLHQQQPYGGGQGGRYNNFGPAQGGGMGEGRPWQPGGAAAGAGNNGGGLAYFGPRAGFGYGAGGVISGGSHVRSLAKAGAGGRTGTIDSYYKNQACTVRLSWPRANPMSLRSRNIMRRRCGVSWPFLRRQRLHLLFALSAAALSRRLRYCIAA